MATPRRIETHPDKPRGFGGDPLGPFASSGDKRPTIEKARQNFALALQGYSPQSIESLIQAIDLAKLKGGDDPEMIATALEEMANAFKSTEDAIRQGLTLLEIAATIRQAMKPKGN